MTNPAVGLFVIVVLGAVVVVLLLTIGTESAKDSRVVGALRQFAICELILVVLPLLMIVLLWFAAAFWGPIALLGFLFAKGYLFLPSLIFGKSHFTDLIYISQAAAVYTVIAMFLSFLRFLPSKSPSVKCSRCGGQASLDTMACAHCGFQFATVDNER